MSENESSGKTCKYSILLPIIVYDSFQRKLEIKILFALRRLSTPKVLYVSLCKEHLVPFTYSLWKSKLMSNANWESEFKCVSKYIT